MIGRSERVFPPRALIVDDELARLETSLGRATEGLARALEQRDVDVVRALSYEDGRSIVSTDASLQAVLLDWNLGHDDAGSHAQATALLHKLRERHAGVPVFLLADRQGATRSITIEVAEMVDEFVWLLEDTADFVAGRVLAAIDRYRATILPPYARALAAYSRLREHSWSAPGHQGGIAFTKLPAGRAFFDFYGENLFRTDMGIERGQLGSLLDHTGPVAESERYAARVFGAHRSYSGVVGTSGSNRSIMQACMSEGDLVVLDRNCHKSIEQGLMLTGALPVYLLPTRNRYGIIGPIAPTEMTPEAIRAKALASPISKKAADQKPVYSVVTNCTYDGLCYDAVKVQELLEQSCDRIHFDEAWYGYARFNPMYANHFAMRGDPREHTGPTVFATHSTHKLLAALSQASFIHIRDGRGAIDHARFNQAYMMHTTTSPLYAIVASNDISSAMMDGQGGHSLTQEVIEEAVDFRQTVGRIRRAFGEKNDWFFKPWNAEQVLDPKTRPQDRVRGRAGGALVHESGAVAHAARRRLARLRGHRAGLVHARPDQGQHPEPGHGRRRQAPGHGSSRGAGERVLHALRDRADPSHRLPDHVPVLDRHHQGQVGDARSPTCSRSSATTTRTTRSPTCCRSSPRSTRSATATSGSGTSATRCSTT